MLVGDSLLEVKSDVNCGGVTNKQQYSLLSLLVKLKRNSQTLPIIYGIASIVIWILAFSSVQDWTWENNILFYSLAL